MSPRCPSWAVVLVLLSCASPAAAQHEHHTMEPPAEGWSWSGDASVFLTANFQVRKFTDFYQVESQNWFMGMGARRAGRGRVTLEAMLSLEPFTMRDLGSSQVFQTGETFEGVPLIDYQHPHDLFMRLKGQYARPIAGATLTLDGAIVGDPALGPTPFMHRAAAGPNPTAPLGHHMTDSTHITPGVVTVGVHGAGGAGIEASAFHGREPDDNRLDLDLGALDSWSARVSWRTPEGHGGGRFYVQASGGRVHEPSPIEPGDQTKLTASLEYQGAVSGRGVALAFMWGQNHNVFGTENAWMAEATVAAGARGTVYSRAEVADKHIIHAGGEHPPDFFEADILSRVGALTLGYAHRLLQGRGGALAAGADGSVYYTPENIFDSYGHPFSAHVFLRWTPR